MLELLQEGGEASRSNLDSQIFEIQSAFWEVPATRVLCSQTDAAMAMVCSKMVVREVRDMVASGRYIFAFQDVLLHRTVALNICHDYNGYEGT